MSGNVIEINANEIDGVLSRLRKLAADPQTIRVHPMWLGWLAKAVLTAAAPKPEHGPTFHGRIRAHGDAMEGIGGDGLRFHVGHAELLAPVIDVDFTIPRPALDWISKNHRIFKSDKDSMLDPVAEIRLAFGEDGPTNEDPGRIIIVIRAWEDDEAAPAIQYEGPLVAEAYPPISHLFEAAREAKPAEPAALSLDFLADTRVLRTADTAEPTIKYTRSVKAKRPAPALLEFWEREHLRAAALIQPRLSVEDAAAGGES